MAESAEKVTVYTVPCVYLPVPQSTSNLIKAGTFDFLMVFQSGTPEFLEMFYRGNTGSFCLLWTSLCQMEIQEKRGVFMLHS